MAHWKARAGIKECKRMADAGSITNFMVGWKVEASHFIGAALGNHTSSHTLFQNGPLKGQGWHQGMQKDGRCWLNHQFHSGLKVEASHFIVAALGNHTSSHTLFQNGPLKGQGWHQGMQKDGRCWLTHQFHSGLKGWSQPFVWWQSGGIGTKMKECKEMVCPSSLSVSSHGTGPGSLSEVVPPPEASLIKWSMAVDKNNLGHGCTAKTWTIWTNFSYNPEITIKWGEWPPEGAPLEVHKTKYSIPWPLSFYRGYVHGYPPAIWKPRKVLIRGIFQERFQAVPNSQTSNSSWNLRNCPIQDQLLMFWPWRGKSWKRCAGAADDPTLLALSWNAGCPNLSISSHIAGLATGLATKLVACYQLEEVRSTEKTWPNRSCWLLCTLQYQIPIRRHVKVTSWR